MFFFLFYLFINSLYSGILIPASSAAVSKQDPKAKDKDKKEGDDKMTLNINSTQIIINRASMRKGSRIV